MKDPGANPQPRWASFHRIFTQPSRQHATRIPAAREGDAAEAGGEDGSEAPVLGSPCARRAQGALLQPCQTAAQREGSASPAWPRAGDRTPHTAHRRAAGPGAPRGGRCVVARAKSTGRKCAALLPERELRRGDPLVCLEGRHDEQETTKAPPSPSAAL